MSSSESKYMELCLGSVVSLFHTAVPWYSPKPLEAKLNSTAEVRLHLVSDDLPRAIDIPTLHYGPDRRHYPL